MYFGEKQSYKGCLHDIIDCLVTALEASDFLQLGIQTGLGICLIVLPRQWE